MNTQGAPLESFQAGINWSTSQLQLIGIYLNGFTQSNNFTLFTNIGTGTASFAIFSGTPPAMPAADTEVVWALFKVLAAGPSPITFTPGSVELNGVRDPVVITTNGSVTAGTGDILVSMPKDATGDTGHHKLVPITVNPGSKNVHSFDLVLEFNPSVLQAASVVTTPATASWTPTVVIDNILGRITISLFTFSPCGIQGGIQDVAKVDFLVVGSPSTPDQTPLDLVSGISDDFVSVVLDDGLFTVCLDADNDGYTVCDGDCNDANASINPGASDANCDGTDQNCSGVADEGALPFQVGSIQGQDGWSGGTVPIATSILQGVDQSGSYAHAGVGSWQISNRTPAPNGVFNSWPFSPGLSIAAGQPCTGAGADQMNATIWFRSAALVADGSNIELDLGTVPGEDRNNFLAITNSPDGSGGLQCAPRSPME